MKILIVHNFYRQPGGEDAVFREEAQLLRAAGHHVVTMSADNAAIESNGAMGDCLRSVWNRGFAGRVAEMVRQHDCDVAHFHNTLPIVSPASLRAARAAGAAVVATLHNYRMVCPSATLFRDGAVCESCTGKWFPWRGVANGCYRGSKLATAAVGLTTAVHHAIGTWRRQVDRFLVLSDFARDKFAEAGFPDDKMVVKPNFVAPFSGARGRRDSVLFIGRLSAEKGIDTLLRAAMFAPDLSVRIAGDGPLADQVGAAANRLPNVTWLGNCNRERINEELGRAVCLAFPSQWYEGMPMTILEAFAARVPVVASRCGALPEIVEDGVGGLLVPTGDSKALGRAARRILQAPELRAELSEGAFTAYQNRYSPNLNLLMLERVYADALSQRHSVRRVS